MDVSVVAAVGSFFMSERVLKPKATLLVILGCLLTYDLTTKTHDVASLRVYRGPALLAFTLMMVAYSLRTWRRNGVACDELLFLPGTAHAESSQVTECHPSASSEGDVAAGPTRDGNRADSLAVEMTDRHGTPRRQRRSRSRSLDSSLSSIREVVNSWEDDDGVDDEDDLENNLTSSERAPLSGSDRGERTDRDYARQPSSRSMHAIHSSAAQGSAEHASGAVERFRENHPGITRIGSFFFFRSSSTSTQSAAYAPSGPSVVGAALDLSMPILFNFHLFIEAFNRYDAHGGPETSAKILPLIFLTVLIVRTTIPPGRRGRFWSTMMYTFMAPFHASRFRDSFLGDVLTSLVRPLQDIVFALAYYVTVVYGTLTSKYGLSDSGRILESSRLLHNVILPSCSFLPLWWRFLQALRESYDSGHRWPHLGNAFKYLSAALVILYGMTHPEERTSVGWICSFLVALIYQLWWDTVMDWELFVIAPRQDETHDAENSCLARIYSVRGNSHIMLFLQRYVFQSVRDILWSVYTRVPSWKQIQLRPRRLYKDDAFYWRIFAYNVIFRATWMLCFIPSYQLDGRNFKSDTHTYVGVLLPIAEIFRRTLWGFLLLEVKTIHMTDNSPSSYGPVDARDESEVSTDMVDSSKHGARQFLPSWLGHQQQLQHDAATLSSRFNPIENFTLDDEMRQKLFVAELSLWAIAFIGLGLWATEA